MKKAVRQFAHGLGFEIKRYLPSASDEAQLSKMLQMIDVNLIFDIGANEGQFVRKVRDYGYAKRIVSFEPLSSARKRLVSYVLGDSAWDVHEQSALEWQVLDGACETLQQACGVICELSLVSLYEGQKLWRDIVDRLDREGFMLWGLHKGFVDPRTGQQLQADGIFLRRDIL
jgi:hypothetical protein